MAKWFSRTFSPHSLCSGYPWTFLLRNCFWYSAVFMIQYHPKQITNPWLITNSDSEDTNNRAVVKILTCLVCAMSGKGIELSQQSWSWWLGELAGHFWPLVTALSTFLISVFNNYSSSPNGLWVNIPFGLRPHGLLTQRPGGREEL